MDSSSIVIIPLIVNEGNRLVVIPSLKISNTKYKSKFISV